MGPEAGATGSERRRLLRATDQLLESIEQLRLLDVVQVPDHLQTQLSSVAATMGENGRRWSPATLADAHDKVFRLQLLLLHGGGAHWMQPGPTAAQPSGDARVRALSLPSRRRFGTSTDWLEQVGLTVQRAHDRTRYLDAQAHAARRLPGAEAGALFARRDSQARAAHEAFERLAKHAEWVTGRRATVQSAPTLPISGRLELEDLVIDLDIGEVQSAGRPVTLTPCERACLAAIVGNQDRPLTREALQYLVWGDEPTLDVHSKTLDVHMSHLRTKLGYPSYVETVEGIGYRARSRSADPTTSMQDLGQVRERRRAERLALARGSSGSPPSAAPRPAPAIDRRPGR